MRRASYRSVSGLRIHARLDSAHGLPSSMAMTRGAGSWSRQSAVALDGTTFIVLGSAVNTARFDYGGGLEGVLVEPTRTNDPVRTNFVDADVNDIPDAGWLVSVGAGGVDFNCVAGGPHGGVAFRLEDTAVVSRGCNGPFSYTDNTALVFSIWVHRSGAGGAGDTIRGWETAAGRQDLTLSAAPHDWTRYQGAPATSPIGVGGVTDWIYLQAQGDPTGVVTLVMPMLEPGDCASSYIQTVAAATTRAAELLTVDPSLVGRTSGDVQFQCRFDYASTAALTVRPCLFPWAAGYEVVFDPADDKIKVVVAGVDRAETAALAFARQSWHDVRVIYGASGQRLIVDGVETTNSTAWGDPGVLATYLGSRAASVNCRPHAFARFTSAWL